jgi:heterodisulfide reductase subunit A
MMDMRAFSKGYWDYFGRAKDRYGVHYHRVRVSALREDPLTHDLILHFPEENGKLRDERFNLVVLSVGMEISDSVRELGHKMGIELDEYGFCHTVKFNPLETSRPGIYAAGPFREPKDIPESVVEASGAAAAAAMHLAPARFTLTTQREFPPEKDVSQEEIRVGVFVCSCGSNIGGFLEVPEVTEAAGSLPLVAHSEWNLYTCSQDSIQHITEKVREHQLNRVVVASCTPLTHQPLFQDSLRAAGLNPYLFEMANIRNQCSWVHSHDRKAATQKATDLVRMAVARAALLEPEHTVEVPVQQAALVVGGGAAGMTAALALAGQGFPVHLVEKTAELGGNLRHIFTTPPSPNSCEGEKDPQSILNELVSQVCSHPSIAVHLFSTVTATSGFMGNFTSTIQQANGDQHEIRHGVTLLATGGQEYRGPEYGYGTDDRIITQQQLESALAKDKVRAGSIVMIQCVGPGEKYCSRICCSVSLKNAIRLKERFPDTEVVILYQDIRAYGFKERLYTQARERGVLFVRYDSDHRPDVRFEALEIHAADPRGDLPAGGRFDDRTFDNQPTTELRVQAWDAALDRQIDLCPDLLVLSMPVVPQKDARQVAGLFKVSLDADNFFLEAHVKLRPVDFASDGVFMAGMAHYPKLLDETIIQAQAAAARAARVLSRQALSAGGRVAEVDPSKCTGCLTCVRICPFGVPKIRVDLSGVGGITGAAYIEAAVCQGCGSCVAECPARAIQLHHYTDVQIMAKVEALLNFGQEPVRGLENVLVELPEKRS